MANGHGGRRAGAGRKPGSVIKRTREIANAVVASGLTPLEYMMAVVHDVNADQHRRDEMAKAAAPYIHPRLNSMSMSAKVDAPPRPIAVVISPVPTGHYLPMEEARRLSNHPSFDEGDAGIVIGDDNEPNPAA